MVKVNNFRYEDIEKGLAIVFNPSEDRRGKYSFSVVEISTNEEYCELTEQLRASVKNKEVPERFTRECAAALFALIESGEFKELTSGEDVKKLFADFKNRFGEIPEFEITNLSTKTMPRYVARLTNYLWEQAKSGSGRTMSEARADALRNLTAYLDG